VRVALLGLGVMGGSLARALSRRDVDDPVGWALDAADRAAAADHGISIAESADKALQGADMVVLATPLSTIPALAEQVARSAPSSARVTDVASLQRPVLAHARSAGLAERWVTSHPLAGSEQSGFGAARDDLYSGAPVYLSADAASAEARAVVESLWRNLGAAPSWMEAGQHDRRMARVSHLPQVVATALADALAETGVGADALGPGGRDTTRLAGSSPSMWGDLLAHADPALVAALRAVARRLEEDADALADGDVTLPVQRLLRAGAWRRGS